MRLCDLQVEIVLLFFFSNLDAFYLIFLFNFPVVQTIKNSPAMKETLV